MKKLFALLVLVNFSIAGYYAQAQSCRLLRDSITAGNEDVGDYSDYIYAGDLLGEVHHVDSGSTSGSYKIETTLYTNSEYLTQVLSVFVGDTTPEPKLVYTLDQTNGYRIAGIIMRGGKDSDSSSWRMVHEVFYNGNQMDRMILGMATQNAKGIPASLTNFVWTNGNITKFNILLGSDTIEFTATFDDKSNVYKHMLNTEGALFLMQQSSANNIVQITVDNQEVIPGDGGFDTIPAGTIAMNNTYTYNTQGEVVTKDAAESLFTERPYTMKFIYDCSSGIMAPVKATSINVYPNPTADFISLENASFSGVVKIYDIAGKVVFNQNISTTASSLDVRSLKAGVYYVEMTDNNKVFKGKFLKN